MLAMQVWILGGSPLSDTTRSDAFSHLTLKKARVFPHIAPIRMATWPAISGI